MYYSKIWSLMVSLPATSIFYPLPPPLWAFRTADARSKKESVLSYLIHIFIWLRLRPFAKFHTPEVVPGFRIRKSPATSFINWLRGKGTANFPGYISHFIPNIIPPQVFSFKTGSQSTRALAEEACCGAAFAGRASLSPRKGPPPASWGKRNAAPISAHGLRHHSSLHPPTIKTTTSFSRSSSIILHCLMPFSTWISLSSNILLIKFNPTITLNKQCFSRYLLNE